MEENVLIVSLLMIDMNLNLYKIFVTRSERKEDQIVPFVCHCYRSWKQNYNSRSRGPEGDKDLALFCHTTLKPSDEMEAKF